MKSSVKPRTFDGQNSLPKLPIPELEVTLQHYFRTVGVLQSNEEHEITRKCVEEFLTNEGPKLQELLIEYAQDKSSFIEDFWYESYLNYKESVVLNVNPFFVLEDDPTPTRANQISRAASLIHSSLKFVNALRKEILPPDVFRDAPLCMHQFQMLFGATRVPTLTKDHVKIASDAKHIVVLCRNQFYWFDVVWEDGTPALTEKELIENLRAIRADASKLPDELMAEEAVGVFTTEHRAQWARIRQKLEVENSDTLDMIDRALFLVCLDHTAPPTASDFAATALHGTYSTSPHNHQIGSCMNRWYDKLQIIVCDNGVAGVNFEHSVVDGHTVLRFASDVFTDTVIRFAQSISGTTQCFLESAYKAPSDTLYTTPHKLEWNLSKELQLSIRYSEARLSDLICQHEIKVLEFKNYGKRFITQHKCSPDAFVQVAFLAAYYMLYGTAVNQYEPAMTKRFLHGRTEAIRSMTPETFAFIEKFCGQTGTELEHLTLLRKATASHSQIVKRCAGGQGVERHLFALQQIAASHGLPEPAFFKDSAYKTLGRSIISTSNCGNPSLRLFGFGPVVPEGFGIGYIIKDDGIQFCAASKHRQTQRYLDTLHEYLMAVHDLVLKEDALIYPNRTKRAEFKLEQRDSEYEFSFFDSSSPTHTNPTTAAPTIKPTPLIGKSLF
ncbi:choline/Carnitine O-acyltransferase [Thraustotheca clavata]|uniref:Choline/Carnitine O-acyltransferase n=1 Tax=Thraustotheca clavata TaxID=74557 RepID=A0A1W0A536_9STRA|nr:choline/Carnitine O-acyltransferase [Thraustotheca clavata]